VLETATVKQALFRMADPWVPVALAAATWAACLAVAALRGRPVWAVAAILPAAALCGWLGWHLVPVLEAKKSARPLWSSYERVRKSEGPVGLLSDPKDTTLYYGQGRTVRLKTDSDLERFLAGPGEKFLVATARDHQSLSASGRPGRFEVVGESHATDLLVRCTPPP
jgi:hypothetical protein